MSGFRVIRKLKSAEDIIEFVKSPQWSIKEFLSRSVPSSASVKGDGIDLDHFNKLSAFKLSGDEIQRTLKQQIGFIETLQGIKLPSDIKAYKKQGDVLTFEKLMADIKALRPDVAKGELKSSWDPMSLPKQKSEQYYVLHESLHK